MTARRPHSADIEAEMDQIEAILDERGPCPAHQLVKLTGMCKHMIKTRLSIMQSADRAHVSFKKYDNARRSTVGHYAAGPDPRKAIIDLSITKCQVHAAFFGRMA